MEKWVPTDLRLMVFMVFISAMQCCYDYSIMAVQKTASTACFVFLQNKTSVHPARNRMHASMTVDSSQAAIGGAHPADRRLLPVFITDR
jgi:hypothetical protein